MNTKWILTASALILGAAGLTGTFAPDEFLAATGIPSTGITPLLVQLLAAALLGFAMVNWMAKDSLMGGIYNRPLAVGNLLHFTVSAITLIKLVMHGASPALIVATVIYTLLAIAFSAIVFGPGIKTPASA